MVQITPMVVRDGAVLVVPPASSAPNDGVGQANIVPPSDPTHLHPLQERWHELDDAWRQLALEQEVVDRELGQQMGGGRAHARAQNVNDEIVNAKPDENQFTRAGQNIMVVAALLETLSDPLTPEAQRVQRWMAELLPKQRNSRRATRRGASPSLVAGPPPRKTTVPAMMLEEGMLLSNKTFACREKRQPSQSIPA